MTPYVLTNAEKLRRLPWNTALNATNNVFASLTFFGPAFVLFLNELNFSNTQIGFLLSLFPFTGLVALVVAPAVARFGYKRTFLTFYGLRKCNAAGLLLVPWVLAEFGAGQLPKPPFTPGRRNSSHTPYAVVTRRSTTWPPG
jgi:hypothetical protein